MFSYREYSSTHYILVSESCSELDYTFIRRSLMVKRFLFLVIVAMMAATVLTGCGGDGSDGNDGATVADIVGSDEFQSALDAALAGDAASRVSSESCSVCHNGSAEFNGDSHQAVYNQYTDTSALGLDITSVVNTGGTLVMTFSVTENGAAYTSSTLAADMDQERFGYAVYDSATRDVTSAVSFSTATIVSQGNGVYTITASSAVDPSVGNGFAYAYIAQGKLSTEGMQLYDSVADDAMAFGDISTYASTANDSGCQKCHGTPYMKHGYRAAVVAGVPDFVACKLCHVDTTAGGHQDWQLLYDDPEAYADNHVNGTSMTDAEKAKYAYKRSVMADTHMSHNMEFAYPQSMLNCVTCHEGKLDETLSDANFVYATCQSCHAVDKLAERIPHFIPDPAVTPCSDCHKAGGIAPTFKDIHNGYEPTIYTSAGVKYAEGVTVSIDSATLAGNALTVNFSAASTIAGVDAADITPSVWIGGYGYDTKDFIVGSHGRDADGNRVGEYTFGGALGNFSNPVTNGASWSVTFDVSALDADGYVTDGVIKRLEVIVAPKLMIGEVQVGVNAASKTFDLATAAFVDFYSPIVDVAKCNDCHSQLATTFHSADRGGNITACRVCHVVGNGGSHLEMQSRSIDSYVHAIHSFQPFDTGDIDFSDNVEQTEYDHHVESTYPNFSIMNCESCHNAGTYNVPSQARSLPGIFSASETWSKDREIGTVPSYVAGPASRACGSCHRAEFINEDDAGGLESFNAHTKAFGYLEEDSTGLLAAVIEKVMAVYK
jgi:OmcA/MtrC family decaheme c-type cytochrome